MKYVSIDIETSGLDPKVNKVLSIGAIIEDTERPLTFERSPKFHAIIPQRSFMVSPRAAVINMKLMEIIAMCHENPTKIEHIENITHSMVLEEKDVVQRFYNFLADNLEKDEMIPSTPITINVAGKNFASFDRLFLEQLPKWQQLIKVRHRVIDPAVLLVDWSQDKSLPSLDECKQRAGIDGKVEHDALSDAWDVIQVLRTFYTAPKKNRENRQNHR